MRSQNLFFAISLLAACVEEPDVDPAPAGPALPPEIAAVDEVPTMDVCAGGRWQCFARIRTVEAGSNAIFLLGGGLGPSDLQSAYALDASGGSDKTIAIVDAYHYANAASDLATYRSHYGLPPCTVASGCLRIVNQNGQTSPLPQPSPPGDDWSVEAALDLDSASAACPNCKLVLVEANDDQGDGLFVSQNGAAALGATVISNSWGGPETAGDPASAYESYFDHPGVGIFVATGDNGYNDGGQGPDYPGTSAFVTGVGGTTLVTASNPRGWSESAWSSGGSACALSIPKPSWQTLGTCTHKASSDVSAVGNPSTGIAVYNAHAGGWTVVGGTSAATPIVAAIYALTGHGADAPSFAYGHASAYYDVTTGSNGSCGTGNILCHATTGWDGPSGMGTPNGAVLEAAPPPPPPPNQPPVAAITQPADGAVVAPSFGVSANATDDVAVTHVELYIDGSLSGSVTASPYAFTTPSLADGAHTLEARAYDGPGLTGSSTITVTVQGTTPPPPDAGPGPSDPDAGTGPGPDPDAGPVGPGEDDGFVTGGCGCTTGGSPADGGLAALTFLLAIRASRSRRRR